MNIQPDAHKVRELAYRLWEQRGCPEGCADELWLEAEKQLSKQTLLADRQVDEAVKESFPASDAPATGLPDKPPANADDKWAASGKARRPRRAKPPRRVEEANPPGSSDSRKTRTRGPRDTPPG